jgi:hypothetical protein
MTTSPITSPSEAKLRTALIDVVYAQWQALGVPVHARLDLAAAEVIDPEPLLWCSLRLLPDDPRLAEGVRSWVAAHRASILRKRMNALERRSPNDPRTQLWREVAAAARGAERGGRGLVAAGAAAPIGRRSEGSAALLLKSRDLLGNDCRSVLVVHLLSSERGVRLREVAQATGYSYRSLSDAATAWQHAGAASIDRGHCRLTQPSAWRELLGCGQEPITVVDWFGAFEATLELLRFYATADASGLASTHPLVAAQERDALAVLAKSTGGAAPARTPAVAALRAALAG